jgi:hypothetical protein
LIVRVDVQHPNNGSSNGRFAPKVNRSPFEVMLPQMPPWMKEFSYSIGLGIDACEVGSFVKIAIDTCKGQII